MCGKRRKEEGEVSHTSGLNCTSSGQSVYAKSVFYGSATDGRRTTRQGIKKKKMLMNVGGTLESPVAIINSN